MNLRFASTGGSIRSTLSAPCWGSLATRTPRSTTSFTLVNGSILLALGDNRIGTLESTVRYLGIEVDDALEIAEQMEI